MSSPTPVKSSPFTCTLCSSEFASKYSLIRHNGRKHINSANISECKNSNLGTDTSNLVTGNSNLGIGTSNLHDNDNTHQCQMCYKQFTRNWSLLKHMEKCKGDKNKLQCEYCLTEFKHEKSRFRHYKICEAKRKLHVVKAEIPPGNSSQINNLTNGTQNINNNNSVNNNIIIVYNTNGNTPFTTDHLKAEDFKKIIELASKHIDNRVISEYSKQIFSHPENACVKKTNLKAGHSHIHMGDNKWHLEIDKNIYPRLALDMANNMSDYLHTKRNQLKLAVFENLRNFVDCMADSGYINTDDIDREKELKKEYKIFMDGLKLIVYGNTKYMHEE